MTEICLHMLCAYGNLSQFLSVFFVLLAVFICFNRSTRGPRGRCGRDEMGGGAACAAGGGGRRQQQPVYDDGGGGEDKVRSAGALSVRSVLLSQSTNKRAACMVVNWTVGDAWAVLDARGRRA